MLINRIATLILISAATAAVCSCSNMSPAHFGKFTFTGTVTDERGKSVRNAWVKVRGWETLTDANGKWQEIQVVNCGTLRDHVDTFEENDSVLITADGYDSNEERFVIKHPGYFQSCTAEQTVVLDTVLKKKGVESPKAAKSEKLATPQQPDTDESDEPAPQPPKRKGTYSL